ncbi:legumain-like [Penaeus japonicus]|uniref:legumain-like n=1 Tax=Penaeus japonicus TaxID=27405 RepID=UPI001C7100AB|nr:legumain-like [Penaeus japonicus]XP_042893435.1 legumain-like [Penaeus japonicus]
MGLMVELLKVVAALALVVGGDVAEARQQKGELWAVLVAGSSSWMNYRHQADVCHAYQILRQHGVPDDHIIVMMTDDIAYNPENPDPGVIINRPGGPNVYQGVPKDYTGEDVTPENFLKALSGDAAGLQGVGSGKVVRSGPNDRLFVNLVDHGAPGIFAFPDSYLKATELADTILAMRRGRRFKEMVVYVEACESGSMFAHLLPDDIGVYAVSASSPNQPSYACYMDEHLNTYLGDVFSVKWMEDTDREDIRRESLKKQFQIVRQEVTESTVMHWGEIEIDRQHLSQFLGDKRSASERKNRKNRLRENDLCLSSATPSPDVPVAVLQSRLRTSATPGEAEALKQQLDSLHQNRSFVSAVMESLVVHVTDADLDIVEKVMHNAHGITRWPCYAASVAAFDKHCFGLARNPFALRVLQPVVNLCEHGYTAEQFANAVNAVCRHGVVTGIE